MLTGKQLILATKPFAHENRRTSWLYTIVTLSLLLSSLLGTLLIPILPVRIVLSIISGLLVVRFFIIYHDFQHHAILQHSKIADIIMTIFGVYILAPVSIWKRSHDHHHQNNSKLYGADIGSFPIATKEKYLSMSKGERIGYLAIRHPATILFGYLTMFVVGMCLRSFISSPKRHVDSLIALIVHVIASVSVFVFFGPQAWFFAAFVPHFIACGLGAYLFYAQHNFPGVFFNERCDWCYEGAALQSSSYMKMNPVMQWFTGNIGFHHIHHLNSRIPFYRLPEAMKALPELQRPTITSLNPGCIIKCLRLKVWDPEASKMISLKQLRYSMVTTK